MFALSKNKQFISMRVHGNSAHIEYSPPDIPQKVANIKHEVNGTFLRSNYTTSFDLHFSIPSPLIVEKPFRLASFIRWPFRSDEKEEPIFAGSYLRVIRVEIYLGNKYRDARFGNLTIMDGDKKIVSLPATYTTIPTSDPYYESSIGTFNCDLNKPIHVGLGISLTGQFTETKSNNELQVIAAKAIFVTGI